MAKRETLAEKEERLAVLRAEMAELEPARKRYFEICFVAGELAEEITESKKESRVDWLKYETRYQGCEFPGMGEAGRDGFATFKSFEQAEELCKLLSSRTYYKAYKVENWEGPGRYILKPDWRRDHDREMIYTGTFIKDLDHNSDLIF